MEDEINILMIESDSTAVSVFQFQLLENTSLRSRNVHLEAVTSIQDALKWLGTAQIPPHLIALNIEIPDIPRNNLDAVKRVYAQLKQSAPDAKIVCLTNLDRENKLFKALESKFGEDAIFNTKDVFQPQRREDFAKYIHEVNDRRTSSSSREMQIAQARAEEQLKNLLEEVDNLYAEVERLKNAVFMGGGDGSQSLVYLTTRIVQQVNELFSWRSEANARMSKIEEKLSDGSNQINLLRIQFWQKIAIYILAAFGIMLLVKLLGLGTTEIVDIIKTWSGKK
ncbi:MAG TPA: hypothetical protein V6C65_04230 [Allocoleopsis sp.]